MKPKAEKWLKRAAVAVGTLVAILFITSFVFVLTADWRLEKRLAAIRAAGDPVTLTDLAPGPVQPERNSAEFLRLAEDHVKAIGRDLRVIHESEGFGTGLFGKPESATMQTAFDAHPELIPLLENAANAPDYAPQADYNVSPNVFMEGAIERVGHLRQVARLLTARTFLLVANGQRDEAMQNCLLHLRLCRQFDREDLIVSHLTSLACRSEAIRAANLLLRTGRVTDESRNVLEAELARCDETKALIAAIKSDRAFGLAVNMAPRRQAPVVAPRPSPKKHQISLDLYFARDYSLDN